jgi:putative SOS response-associated peptidase YedK
VRHAVLAACADRGNQETRRKARGQEQAGRFQGTAADGAGRRHDQHQKREEQTLWARWLGPEHRCVVPFNSFSEFNKAEGGDVWFALDDTRPLACFAGIWTDWTSVRKVKEGETTNDL